MLPIGSTKSLHSSKPRESKSLQKYYDNVNMSSTPNEDAREGYQKLVNVKQGGDPSQQRVVVYVPDTRRKRSPEAEARAQARAEIKEAYKAAALAEELKMVKKQRNRLVDNLSKTGRTPSIAVVDLPETLSGAPKTYVSGQDTSPSETRPFDEKINYSAPIGPAGPKGTPVFDEKINYTSPIGPVGPKGTPVFNNRRNYTSPIGPVGPMDTPVFNSRRNYTSPIGPVGPMDTPVFNSRRNYSAPIGPVGPMGTPVFNNSRRNYSAPIGPMGPMGTPAFNNRRNYSAPIGPVGPMDTPVFNSRRNYSAPIGPQMPSMNIVDRQSPSQQQMDMGPMDQGGMTSSYRQRPGMTRGAPNQGQFQADGMDNVPFQTPAWQQEFGKTYNPRKIHEKYEQLRTENPDRVTELNKMRDDAIKDIKQVVKDRKGDEQIDFSAIPPEQLIPGKTLEKMERNYRRLKQIALRQGRMKRVEALDKAYQIRKQQFQSSPVGQLARPLTPTGQTPSPSTPERDAELLLPGKTEEAVKKIYANRRAKALKKGDKAMMDRLDKALPVRLQRLRVQGANVMKVTPERLIPGTTLEQVESEYKKRRAAAVQKKRQALVAALDKAIIVRRQQLGGSSRPTSSKPVGQLARPLTPTGQTPSPTSPERDAELLLPGKTEDAVRKIYVNRRAKAEKKGDKTMMARLDKALPVRIQRLRTQGANVMKVTPERLIPGATIEQVESEYKKRRAAAVQKKRQALVAALDKAILVRRKQLGGSARPMSAKPRGFTPTGKTPSPTSPERDAELLLPGKTEDAVRKIYVNRRAKAEKKKDKAMVDRLDKALPVRIQRLRAQGANVMKVSPERLIPGKTIEQVESEYKKRRASADQKKRQALVAALDKAIITRRQQLRGASPQPQKGKKFSSLSKVPPEVLIPGKTTGNVEREYKKRREGAVRKGRAEYVAALNKAIGTRRQQVASASKLAPSALRVSPKQKSPSIPGSWRAVFTGVDQKNPRAVSEKYQKLRKERPDDTMKLNALFKQAIEDIKKEKREAIAKEGKVKADKAREEAKKVEQKQKDIDRQIIKTKRQLKKVGQSEQKAASNVQRFTKERDIAAQRRDTRSVQKLTRVAQKRQQNLVRARDSKQKLVGEIRKLEQQKGSISKSPFAPPASPLAPLASPLKLLGPSTSPKPMSQKPAPLKLLAPPKSVKSPNPTTPIAREAERAKQKTMQLMKQRAQAELKQRAQAAMKQKAAQQAAIAKQKYAQQAAIAKQKSAQAAMMKRAKSMRMPLRRR
ncbi:hypothetical protein ATCV1_Z794L [Acanthocystis turfacea chlorella virus 1]|uniref:Uncharacterized protein Z794L n=1 Tax=Chlorovirus heliozoae TaxID=322019 RepID=A7KA54_9PHYC|nr:hypothetical protein ATCV1_Z794L [Acanthocystis turfacea chlorella virus 1]ABT16928.1 hypothetical protein ATCV1_Z794L [Acanthocystis turfacea chlorella virus 1]